MVRSRGEDWVARKDMKGDREVGREKNDKKIKRKGDKLNDKRMMIGSYTCHSGRLACVFHCRLDSFPKKKMTFVAL